MALGVTAVLVVGGVVVVVLPAHGASARTQLTATVQQGTVSSSVTATGSLAPVSETQVDFAVGGTVSAVAVAPGQTVQAGQALATLATTTLAGQVTDAQTTLANDETAEADERTVADAATTTSSSPGGSAQSSASSSAQAQTTLLSDESKVTNDETALTTAQTALADATLTAPVAGEVVAVGGSVGQQVSAGSTETASTAASSGSSSGGSGSGSAGSGNSGSGSAGSGSAGSGSATGGSSGSQGFVTIADTTADTVTAEVPEADVASLATGMTAAVTFPAAPTVTAQAKVTSIAPVGTSTDSLVEFPVVITLDALPTGVRYGETADVAVTTKSSPADALSVPTAAVHTSGGTSTVTLVGKGGSTSTVRVTTGIVGDDGTQVSGTGIHAGDEVSIGTVDPNATTSSGTGGTGGSGFGGGSGSFGGGAGGFGGGSGRAGRTGGTGGGAGAGAGTGAGTGGSR
ncbi:hypothetical protein BIU90_12775 [Curtobacterium sp. MCBA15_001]|nr:hypothetical protein BIU90_12775 [Curtobacterium sp. MCBA15_001]